MPNIKALDFANYVNDSRLLLKSILQDKSIDVQNDTLKILVAKTDQLVNPSQDDDYVLPTEWQTLIDSLATDEHLIQNGGAYGSMSIFAYAANTENTTYVQTNVFTEASVSEPVLLITSDGQEFTKTTHVAADSFTITWDSSKDLVRENGQKYRVLKVYFTAATSAYNRQLCAGYPSSTSSGTAVPYLLFAATDSKITTTQQQSHSSFASTYVEAIYLKHVPDSLYITASTRYLRYFYTEDVITEQNAPNFIFSFSGRAKIDATVQYLGDNNSKMYMQNIASTIKKCFGSNAFDSCLDRILVFNNELTGTAPTFNSNDCKVEEVYFTKQIPDANYYFVNSAIKKLVFAAEQTSNTFVITSNYAIETLTLGNDWKSDLNLQRSYYLTKESLLDIISKLHDYSNSTVHTIQFPITLQTMLTTQMSQDISNKNWTISFVKTS